MREIKFRAWSGVMSFFTLEQMAMDMGYVNIDNVMQYTGLKDKNGKEIYEGDIVSVKNGVDVNKFKIEWESFESCTGFPIGPDDDDIVVIGNIYENPELLEA